MLRLILSLFLLLAVMPFHALGQFKVISPVTVKAGEHIVIDANSAKGDVEFVWDKVVFPKPRATKSGKILILSTNVHGKYTVTVVSYDDKKTEEVIINVTTIDDPISDPIKKPKNEDINALRTEMRAGFNAIAQGFDAVHARLKALEGAKPPPPPKTTLAFVTFVGPTLATVAVVNDTALRARLKAAGVKVFVYDANDPGIADRGLDKAVKAAGGVPCMLLQGQAVKNEEGIMVSEVIGQVRLTTLSAANQFLDAYLKD